MWISKKILYLAIGGIFFVLGFSIFLYFESGSTSLAFVASTLIIISVLASVFFGVAGTEQNNKNVQKYITAILNEQFDAGPPDC
jgi:methyl-accepting chemotaxis protein